MRERKGYSPFSFVRYDEELLKLLVRTRIRAFISEAVLEYYIVSFDSMSFHRVLCFVSIAIGFQNFHLFKNSSNFAFFRSSFDVLTSFHYC